MAGNAYSIELAQTLLWKVRNFSESTYYFNPGDNLTNLMGVLLGESGTGQMAAIQVAARLSQQYLQFSDLETTIGELLNSPRLVSELYDTTLNPFTDQLSIDEWKDVVAKDSIYRERLIAIATAILKGASVLGIQAMAEATAQVKFQVIENWTNASGVVTASGWSRGFGNFEVILIPNVPSGVVLSDDVRQSVIQKVEQIKPVGSIITLITGSVNNFTSVNYTTITGTSQFFHLQRDVLAGSINLPTSVVNNNNPGINSRYWLQAGQTVTAPYFAFTQTQEKEIDVTNNIVNVQVTPILGSTSSVTTMLGTPSLPINSTLFGEQ